ncbi:hypothetical protein M407DRAFT_18464 [Tulasnella calospora MUT 4182]|uniref:Uncharacterized protein n=1 Tax=Tulasnella calospora MUT 4182 TaxID=1051891 RepID=A0A0C3QVK6_9AGAM|nr:hypothetical protein M407DRAFT_18456 [Tulasnella calospora MUT 4182]KIO32704.1 hypothetical protein M407DRAFT_18464 [Tulasnella calospora MUT 4182]
MMNLNSRRAVSVACVREEKERLGNKIADLADAFKTPTNAQSDRQAHIVSTISSSPTRLGRSGRRRTQFPQRSPQTRVSAERLRSRSDGTQQDKFASNLQGIPLEEHSLDGELGAEAERMPLVVQMVNNGRRSCERALGWSYQHPYGNSTRKSKPTTSWFLPPPLIMREVLMPHSPGQAAF